MSIYRASTNTGSIHGAPCIRCSACDCVSADVTIIVNMTSQGGGVCETSMVIGYMEHYEAGCLAHSLEDARTGSMTLHTAANCVPASKIRVPRIGRQSPVVRDGAQALVSITDGAFLSQNPVKRG